MRKAIMMQGLLSMLGLFAMAFAGMGAEMKEYKTRGGEVFQAQTLSAGKQTHEGLVPCEGGKNLVLHIAAESSGELKIKLPGKTGSLGTTVPFEAGEQMIIIPAASLKREGKGVSLDSSEKMETECASKGKVLLLSAGIKGDEKLLPEKGLWIYEPSSMFNPVGRAFPLYGIVDADYYHPGIKGQKNNFKTNMKLLSGIDLPQSESDDAKTNLVVIGRAENVRRGFVKDSELEKMGWDGFIIKRKDSNLVIASRSVQGAGYGVYRFLEKQGLKYFAPGATSNFTKTNQLKAADMSDRPFFAKRLGADWCIYGDGGLFGDYRAAKIDEVDPVDKTIWVDHTAAFLVPKKLYYKDHPEYYVMSGDGKPMNENIQDVRLMVCYTNKGGIEVAAERLLKWIDKQPERLYFVVQQGDDSGMCACENCCAKRAEGWNDSDLFLHWINSIAKKAMEKHPDKILLSYAYALTQPPPNVNKVEYPNIHIMYCPWPTKTSAPNAARGFDAPGNSVAEKDLTGWLKAVPPAQFGIYDYIMGNSYGQRGMAQRIKWLARHGMKGSLWYLGAGSKFFGKMFQYVHARLNWNPLHDTRQLEDEFIYGYYGKSAPVVAKIVSTYFNALDRDPRNDGFSVDPAFFSAAFVTDILNMFDEAIKLEEKESLKQELAEDKSRFAGQVFWVVGNNPANEAFPIAWKYVLQEKKDEIEKKPKADWKGWDGILWGQLKIKGAVNKDNLREMTPVLKDMLADPVKAAAKYRVNKADFVKESDDSVTFLPYAFDTDTIWDSYSWKCEARDAFFLYGNRTDSSDADCKFNLKSDFTSGAVIRIQGQRCDKEALPNSEMLVSVNGKTVFEGRNTFIALGWSEMSIAVPAGVFKKGENTIHIENMSQSDSRISHWIGISSVTISKK